MSINTQTHDFSNPVAGGLPTFKALDVTIAANQTVTVGTVLASNGISADGETFSVCNSASETAIQKVPVCVALEAATTGANETATIKAAFMGEIDVTLNAGGSDTQYTHVDALRARGLYIRNKQA